jgi:2,3-bisphosphoglycerate-independent phosphoglycerate mutase
VTFFFNGGVEKPNVNEERILVPSPTVKTYNMKPEMSAVEVTDRVVAAIDQDCYDVIIMNYANPDMVGHTGILDAAIEAVRVVDQCLARVTERVLAHDGVVLMTADHGNCETMQCPITGGPFTAHTNNKVPFILISDRLKEARLREGGALCDIAPTMLELLNIDIPREMTGRSLILHD